MVLRTLFHLDSVDGMTSIRYGTGLWARRKARAPLRDPKAPIRDQAIALGFDAVGVAGATVEST